MRKLLALLIALSFGAQAQTLVRPLQGGTGVANANTKTITLGGPFVTSGAFTTTLTATGTTGVTLPTSGTLATTASTFPIGQITGLGTGVATALAVNVGTAGSPVLNGGALGSPSSAGTIPAFTLGGTIAGGGNQLNNIIIGTTTPLPGSFTTLGASGVVTVGAAQTLSQASVTGIASLQAQTATTNTRSLFAVVPNGNSRGVDFVLHNKSDVTTNYEALQMGYDSGAAAWYFVGLKGGTGTLRPILLDATGNATTAAANITLNIDGTVKLSTLTTDATHTDATVCRDTTSGVLYAGSGTIGICLGTSSERYKTDVTPLKAGLPEILALQPISYKLDKDHGDPNKVLYGFTAEQGGKALPALMGKDTQGKPNTFDYLGLVAPLVNSIKDLNAQLTALQTEVINLRGRVHAMDIPSTFKMGALQ